MADVKKFSISASGNNSASPDGFPEGMAPSGVNDSAREVMAAVKRWYVDAEWRDFDDTPTLATSASFTVATDLTDRYHDGRRVRIELQNSDTLYATITSASFSSNTRVSVATDSGSLSSSLSAVAVGWAATNQSEPAKLVYALDANGNPINDSPFGIVEPGTTSYELALSDAGKLLSFSSTATSTLSIPSNGSAGFSTGTLVSVLQAGSGPVNVSGNSGVTVNSANGTETASQWSTITVLKIGTNTWVVVGDATT